LLIHRLYQSTERAVGMASKRIGDVRRVLGDPRLPGIRLVFLLVWVLSSAAVSEVQTDQDENDADDRTYKLH
jgi:hypothetical protein